MVELLLDKGVDLDLKDAEGRTVVEMLEQFTANQATEIRRKIKSEGRKAQVACVVPDIECLGGGGEDGWESD